ncbi:MAG TPA: 6-phosphofructokinase [Candidatus Sumerlaeota bacterium]|nr:6-phosphofructokinase [Candidatus Sumerlaeota bacterium]
MAKAEKAAPVGNMVIGQSGGPTVVINQSLVGAVLGARKHKKIIKNVYGARHGVQGILNQDLINLNDIPRAELLRVGLTPSSALGSVRKKVTPEECRRMFDILRAHDVHYFFYIGGNDSAETANIVREVAEAENYDLSVFHIPKTIDNDLLGTDHCPGYGSAARFVALAFMGDDLDNRALKGIKINIVMGRHAGFLTAAAALGRSRPDSGPHLVYVPELPFDEQQFVADVKKVYQKYGRCMIAASEGIADKDGVAIATKFVQEVDSHGNKQLSGTGALGDYLAQLVKEGFAPEKIRVRADTFGYLQRSFCGCYSETDSREAYQVGEMAVEAAVSGVKSGTISIIRAKGPGYKVSYKLSPLASVAKNTTQLPRRFLNKDGNNISKAFIEYAMPLVGPLPEVGYLEGARVKPKKIG